MTRAQLITFLYRYQGKPDVVVDPTSPTCPPTTTTQSEETEDDTTQSEEPEDDTTQSEEHGGDLLGVEEPDNNDSDQPPPLRVEHIEGHWTVPVHICGPEGKFTGDDVREMTALLNEQLPGFFERASSQLFSMTFIEGSVITVDADWANLSPNPSNRDNIEEVKNNNLEMRNRCLQELPPQSPMLQHLIQIDADSLFLSEYFGFRAGFGFLGGTAAVISPNKFSEHPSSGRAEYTRVAIHELAHSIVRLEHLKLAPTGRIFVNEAISFTGSWPPEHFPYLERPSLACYQYEQLGWPVPEYAQPCIRFTATAPRPLDSLSRGDLNWQTPRFSDNAPITGYTVSISREIPGSSPELINSYEVGPHIKSYLFDSPKIPGSYRLSVHANTRYGAGDSVGVTATLNPAPPPPDDVATLGLHSVTNTSVFLQWDGSNANAFVNRRYEVQYSGGGTTSTEDDASSHGVLLTGLKPGTEYSIQVRSCSESSGSGWRNCGDWGPSLTVTTEAELPPPNPVHVQTGSDWYLLTWEPVEGATAYQIELPSGHWTRTFAPAIDRRNSSVQPNTTYSVRIVSCSGEHLCPWADATEVTFSTTSEQVAPPPHRVSLQEIGGSWADLRWENLLFEMVAWDSGWSYRVEYEYTDGTSNSGRHEARSLPLRIDTQSDTTYQFKVRNCPQKPSNLPCSTWTEFEFNTTPPSSSLDPPIIKLNEAGDIWMVFSWDPVPGATNYDWRQKRVGENNWRSQSNTTEPYASLNYRIDSDAAHIFEVRSCGEATTPCGDWTATTAKTVQSFPDAPPGFPVSVERTTASEIYLEWDPPSSSFISYNVRYYPTEDGRSVRDSYTLQDDVVLRGLQPDTAYTLQIRTCERDPNSSGVVCGERVTVKTSTRPSN